MINWSSRQAPEEIWDTKIAPLIEKKMAEEKTPVVRFKKLAHKIIAEVSLAENTMRVPVDSHGVRIFSDLVPSALVDSEGDRVALLELEDVASHHRDHPLLGDLGSVRHVLATRD